MPRFEPFGAVHYTPESDLARVTAPPYDVLSDDDVLALAARDAHNIVRIDVPREVDGPGRYDAAGALYREWLADGVLRRDTAAAFYRGTMRFTDEAGHAHVTVGVFGGLEVVDGPEGGVLPHEQTTPKAKTDRLDLTRATRANLSAVWGLSMTKGLTATIAAAPALVLGRFVDDDGVDHELAVIDDPGSVQAIAAAVSSTSVVIADGHHRYAIARTYRDERRATDGPGGPTELTLTFVVELAEEQLFVQAIHRLLTELPAGLDLVGALDPYFTASPAGPVAPGIVVELAARGALALVHPDGSGTYLRPRAEAFPGVRDLDSARLEHALATIPHVTSYQHGVDRVVAAVRSGAAGAGVLLRPVPVAEIEHTANEHVLMPPKSTFFAPKPKTGLVLRPLD